MNRLQAYPYTGESREYHPHLTDRDATLAVVTLGLGGIGAAAFMREEATYGVGQPSAIQEAETPYEPWEQPPHRLPPHQQIAGAAIFYATERHSLN